MKTLLLSASAGGLLLTATVGLCQDASSAFTYSQTGQVTHASEVTRRAPTRDSRRRSDVQRELEEMYKQDGRQMPNMELNQMPSAGTRSIARRPEEAEMAPEKKRGFFSRLVPSFMRRDKPEPRVDYSARPQPPAEQHPFDVSPEDGVVARPQTRSAPPAQFTQRPAVRQALPKAEAIEPRRLQFEDGPARVETKSTPVEELLDESTLTHDAEQSEDLSETLRDAMPAPRPGTPAAEVDESSPFTGLTINPAERETEIAEETPLLPGDDLPSGGSTAEELLEIEDAPARLPRPATVESAVEDELPSLSDVEPEQAAPGSPPADGVLTPTEGPLLELSDPPAEVTDNRPVPNEELAGLKGYCLVTLKTERRLVKGSDAHRSVYQGRIYRFASEEAQEEFEDHPSRFVPAQGGQDVVRQTQGLNEGGSLDHAIWYKGKLYLFASDETLKAFALSPKTYLEEK